MKKILAGCLTTIVFSSAALAADGASVYKAKCQACHGTDGKGTAMAPAFKGSHHIQHSTDEQISEIIVKGISGAQKMHKQFAADMPPQKLSDDEFKAVVAYIKGLAGK